MTEVIAISTMNGSRDAGETSDQRESLVDSSAATEVGPPGALSELPPGSPKLQNTFDDDLENIFKEVDEILENDKSKSGKGDGDPCETAEEWQPGREGPLKSKIKGACCEKREDLPYYSSDQHGDGMLSAQPAQQGIVHHLPQEFVGPGSTHAQNNPHPGHGLPHMINHPTNFNFGPVYNMAGLGSWGSQSRGTGTDDPAHKKKNELRVELEKVLCQPSKAGSWYRFDVLRTELQVLEAPLCGIVTQPAEDQ